MDMFSEAQKMLDTYKKAWKRRETKCDWDDAIDTALYKSQKYTKEKSDVLDKLAPKRLCPVCKAGPLLKSKQWVVNKRKTKVICRSCYHSDNLTTKVSAELPVIFQPYEMRFKIDGRALCQARVNLGWPMKRFADVVGWSCTYQRKLERGDVVSVGERTMKDIMSVLTGTLQ